MVDLKGAFDKAPRWLLKNALLDLPLESSVTSLLLAWHTSTPYYLTHQDDTFCIEGNVGVRQGCVAAPFLWIAFIRYWLKFLAGILGWDWIRKHMTVYADDNHLAWEFTSDTQVHQAILELGTVLRSFSDFGMSLNLDKTVAIMSLRGKTSSHLRRKYVQKGKQNLLKVDAHHLLPLVRQHRYLGVVVSYGHYTRQTLQHRKTCAMGSYMILRRWWTCNLPLWRRILLWKACIWPSVTYGLVETGLDSSACLVFRRTLLKQLRWIARSPSHVTHESNLDLLERLGLDDPLLLLAKQVVAHWSTKYLQRSSLLPDDILLSRWLPFHPESHVKVWLQFCFQLMITMNCTWPNEGSSGIWTLLSENGLDEMHHTYRSVFQLFSGEARSVPETSFTCDSCGQTFGTLRGLRVHKNKIHQVESSEITIDATARRHGIDGMPICQNCGVRFTTWFAFDRHLIKGVCNDEVPSSSCTTLQTTSALASTSRTQEHRQPKNDPVLQRRELVDAIREDWAQALNTHSDLKMQLKNYCCVCNQWFQKNHHLTKHAHYRHSDLFGAALQKRIRMMHDKKISAIKWYCPYCDSAFNSPNIHNCSVLLQLAAVIIATDPPLSHGSDGCYSKAGGKRDGSFQRSAPIRPCFDRRRRLRGKQSEEAKDGIGGEGPGIRRRIRFKSRPPATTAAQTAAQKAAQGTWQGTETDRDTAEQFGGGTDSTCNSTRRWDQQSSSRLRLHAIYAQSTPWNGRGPCEDGRPLERATSSHPNDDCVTFASHSLSGIDCRTTQSSSAPHRRFRCKTNSGRGKGSGGSRQGQQLCFPQVELSNRIYGEAGESTSPVCSQSSGHVARADQMLSAASGSQIPCDQTTHDTHTSIKDLAFHARDRQSQSRSSACLHTSGSASSEWGLAACGNTDAALRSSEVCSGNRTPEVLGQGVGMQGETLAQSAASHDEYVVRRCAQWIRLGFVNPDNICYINASLNLCGWAVLHHSLPLRRWLRLGNCILDLATRDDNSVNVSAESSCQPLLQDWRAVHEQNDVAEFLGHMLERVGLEERILGRWGSRGLGIERAFDMPLTHPVAIPLSNHRGSGAQVPLQVLINEWSELSGGQGLLNPPPEHFFLQLLRYEYRRGQNVVLKLDTQVTLDSVISVPLIERGLSHSSSPSSSHIIPEDSVSAPLRMASYRVQGFIMHLGPTPQVGHYIAIIRDGQTWWEKDDDKSLTSYAELSEHQLRNCYVICLSRC